VDIGASDSPPRIWESIARHSIYVGFDPDDRELHEDYQHQFRRAILINEAVTSHTGDDDVVFYLTRFPYCSSTLKPDHQSLSNYLFSDLFAVEGETRARATTLDEVLQRLSLPCVDWFKTDSQGTDLRLFNSLKSDVRSRVLAIDVEPGLIDAYLGEDLFVDTHRELTRSGFWLSRLNICGAVRMRRTSLQIIGDLDKEIDDRFIDRTVRQSPGWCEARYLRDLDWLARGDFTQREYVLLWVFAMLDGQLAFALDLAVEYVRLFGTDNISQVMQHEPIVLMRRSRRRAQFSAVKSVPMRVFHRALRAFKLLI
jgi:hypothetical protein